MGKADDEDSAYLDRSDTDSTRDHSNPNSRRGSEASEKMVKVVDPALENESRMSGEDDDDDELQDDESMHSPPAQPSAVAQPASFPQRKHIDESLPK